MSCPVCRGSDRMPIAPGFYRCTSIIVETLAGPWAGGSSIAVRSERVCGTEYQEGPTVGGDAPKCRCMTYAIGACAECERPICGDHSSLVGGKRLCDSCGGRVLAQAAELQRREDEARSAQQAEATRAAREAALDDVRRREDPTERLLRALWLFSESNPGSPDRDPATHQCDEEALRDLLPDLFQPDVPISLGTKPPWDSKAVAAWFAARSTIPPHPKAVAVSRPGVLGSQVKWVPGWSLPGGSTLFDGKLQTFCDASVTASGELLPLIDRDGLNGHALRQIAQMCGLGDAAQEHTARASLGGAQAPSVGTDRTDEEERIDALVEAHQSGCDLLRWLESPSSGESRRWSAHQTEVKLRFGRSPSAKRYADWYKVSTAGPPRFAEHVIVGGFGDVMHCRFDPSRHCLELVAEYPSDQTLPTEVRRWFFESARRVEPKAPRN